MVRADCREDDALRLMDSRQHQQMYLTGSLGIDLLLIFTVWRRLEVSSEIRRLQKSGEEWGKGRLHTGHRTLNYLWGFASDRSHDHPVQHRWFTS